ncbi:hypothetical protein E1B28_011117 [Marasmius oreades]|uniref:Non-specific serine/threonine protein kinase n=1 Tax=Marasmius oreades TaxID=181124 RepID=A0A9P7UQV5_9AGAR|nr:uncharacterized protein E1B28_011117 [Marasmius oreades]KAG7089431.1 hypothetical protein E1B28_011117 [Marasmius oreades]
MSQGLISSVLLTEGKDRLENYDILDSIYCQGTSHVLKARCIRGRCKGRLVALKKHSSQDLSSEVLHQGLYHLNVVSLFSVFSGLLHRYHVLELCSGGSLSNLLDSRDNSLLPEREIISIARPLFDALSYLNREGIVHCSISPNAILFTNEQRVKLTNFTHAIQLPSQDTTIAYFLEHPQYTSPEILSRKSFDCASDLWSLGVVIFRCYTGELPFQASGSRDLLENVLRGRYAIPSQVSPDFRNLISGLLNTDPSRRPDLNLILNQPPFSDPSNLKVLPQPISRPANKRPHLPYRMPSSKPAYRSSSTARAPLREIQNADLRRVLSDEISTSTIKPQQKRTSSDSRPAITAIGASQNTYDKLKRTSFDLTPLTEPPPGLLSSRLRHLKALSSESTPDADFVKQRLLQKPLIAHMCNGEAMSENGDETESDSDITMLPIGTSRPSALNTTLLSPRVHKTVNGQITILSSRSVLVDFREGERRRGEEGTEVFVISPQGDEVKVYDAPHLNIPTCFEEPKEEHDLASLPRRYWKQYNDASTLVARIRQRTPRMVLYEGSVQFTLMANGPQGDVEILMTKSIASHSVSKKSNRGKDENQVQVQVPTRRLRYSSQTQTLELSNYTTSSEGKEWKTTTHHILSNDSAQVDRDSFKLAGLSSDEDDTIGHLMRFLHVCAIVEADDFHGDGARAVNPSPSKPLLGSESNQKTLSGSGSVGSHVVGGSSRTIGRSLSIVDLAPRPVKFSSSTTKSENELSTGNNKKDVADLDTFELLLGSRTSGKGFGVTDATPSWVQDASLGHGMTGGLAVQSKFIPSVGWCIRHNSRVSQGGRYKIMFLDGAVLDIDVDEEWAELACPDGTKYR